MSELLNSDYRELTAVRLPYAGRQMYMHSFDLENPVMPLGFEDYLDPVRALCAVAGAHTGIAHMTVDEKVVAAGMSQRRPHPHVDGCFVPAAQSWGHGGWAHGCNNVPTMNLQRMSVIVAASVAGCRAWRGIFAGTPASDGDMSHLELKEGAVLLPDFGYLLSPDCIHESMIQPYDVKRSFLRIALPMEFVYE